MCGVSTSAQLHDKSRIAVRFEQREIIKIGSSCLISENGSINHDLLRKITQRVSELNENGVIVTIISSGAVASGRWHLKQLGESEINRQSAAKFGQQLMAQAWANAFGSLAKGLFCKYRVIIDLELEETARSINDAASDTIFILNGDDVRATEADVLSRDNDLLAGAIAEKLNAQKVCFITQALGTESASLATLGTGGFASKSKEMARLSNLGMEVRLCYKDYVLTSPDSAQ